MYASRVFPCALAAVCGFSFFSSDGRADTAVQGGAQPHSQQKVDGEPVRMPEVVVTAPRAKNDGEHRGEFLDEANLKFLQAATSDTSSLLRGVAGVNLQGAGGVSSLPVMHGLGDDRLRVQVNGVNLISSCPNHMNPPLSYVDPAHVESAEVLTRTVPVSAGGDSIGGTIRIESSAPEFADAGSGILFKGQGSTFYRSNGDAWAGSLSMNAAGEKVALRYSGSAAKSDNYQAAKQFKPSSLAATDRDWIDGDEVGSSRYNVSNHEVGLAVGHDSHLFDLRLGFQDIPYQDFPNQRMDMTLNENVLGNLHYTGTFGWGMFEARIYDEHTRHRMDFSEDKQFLYGTAQTILAPGMPMNTDGNNLGGEIRGDITLSARDTLRVGVEGQRYRLDDWWPPSPSVLPAGYTYGGMAPNTFWNINNGERDRLGGFVEWEAQWNSEWLTLMGLRSDTVMMDTGPVQGYNNEQTGMGVYGDPSIATSVPGKFNAADRERTDNNVDMTALLRYTPGQRHFFEVGYSRKTRSPNLYERYAWSPSTMVMEMINFAGDGNYYIGNLGVEPETAHTFSVTADLHGPSKETWGLKITPYFTRIEDYIDARRCPADVCTNANGTAATSTSAVVKALTATTGFVYLQYINQSAQLYGVDLSSHFLVADHDDYGSLTATQTLGYLVGENRETGDNLYNIMPLNGNLALVHRKDRWTNTVEEQLVAPKEEVSQTRNEVKTGGYGLLNLRSSYEWDTVRLDLGIENTLDQFYYQPLGGAYVGQGATMSGGAVPWGTPVPGMGRVVFGGLTVKF
ncbi:MAG: TonB-dependent receptor plug domain-containing protein [Magnetococcales bacterium]|nr:TonB-dependent receptor plug domain-containing protein [Magnetococcales bacterium]